VGASVTNASVTAVTETLRPDNGPCRIAQASGRAEHPEGNLVTVTVTEEEILQDSTHDHILLMPCPALFGKQFLAAKYAEYAEYARRSSRNCRLQHDP
jgi:hypothetical protein